MKPLRAYDSLRKAGNKVKLLLFLCLLAQVFFLLIGSQRISLPSRIVEIVVNSFLPEDLLIKLQKPEIIGFSQLELGKAELWSHDSNLLEISGLSISLNASRSWNNPLLAFEKINFSQAHLLRQKNRHQGIEIKQFSLIKRSPEDTFFVKGDINLGDLSSTMHLEITQFDKNWVQSIIPKQNGSSLTDFLKKAHAYKKTISVWHEKSPTLHLNIRGIMNGPSGELLISQKNGTNNKTKNLLARAEWIPSEKSDYLTFASLEAKADKIYINQDGIDLGFNKPSIKGNAYVNLSSKEMSWMESFFSYQDLLLKGKMSGSIPKLDVYTLNDVNHTIVQILSYSNESKVSLCARKEHHKWDLTGSLKINPKNIDLLAHLTRGNLKVMDGDKLRLQFWTNPTPLHQDYPVQFIIEADNFSVLEAPYGRFRFEGEIANDFTIWVNDAYGKLGKSEVGGKYFQKWNPARYRFLIDGTCHPPDINNWLGLWWDPIWTDFSFPGLIPKGNFSISGVWDGPPSNSITTGWIKTDKIDYKNFEFQSSNIEIEVDKSSTRLKAKNIKHEHGQANGTLVYPRNSELDNLWMDFSFKGDYPVNQAKEVLGEEVSQALSELNASVIYCEANGQIYRDQKQVGDDKNESWYKLYLSSNNPFSYWGIEMDYIEGTLDSSKGLTKVNFDKIGISGGQGTLAVSKNSAKTDQINLDIDLKNADRNRLIQNLMKSSRLQDQAIQITDRNTGSYSKLDPQEGGRIDFSLQAEGPLSEYKHFEGSGNFKLYKVEIGTMHLLGGIRSKLGAFNLPLPSDALSFNQLNAPFLLDHDRILFDQATLLGPLSTFEAKGEVNWVEAEVDLLADLKLAGNLNIPVLKQLVNLADPLSRLSTLKIKGNWENPSWTIHLRANPLAP